MTSVSALIFLPPVFALLFSQFLLDKVQGVSPGYQGHF
jgi:hypothetical protein